MDIYYIDIYSFPSLLWQDVVPCVQWGETGCVQWGETGCVQWGEAGCVQWGETGCDLSLFQEQIRKPVAADLIPLPRL